MSEKVFNIIKYTEKDIQALRFMLDAACRRLSKGTDKYSRDIKEELGWEFMKAMEKAGMLD